MSREPPPEDHATASPQGQVWIHRPRAFMTVPALLGITRKIDCYIT